MLAAHMDEIGLIISYVDEKGFLRGQPIGGVDVMTLVGGRVQFADGALGVIAPEERGEFKNKPELTKVYIDIGAASREEADPRFGQAVSFVRPFADLGQRVVAKALDDRIGCAVLIETLRRLPGEWQRPLAEIEREGEVVRVAPHGDIQVAPVHQVAHR